MYLTINEIQHLAIQEMLVYFYPLIYNNNILSRPFILQFITLSLFLLIKNCNIYAN